MSFDFDPEVLPLLPKLAGKCTTAEDAELVLALHRGLSLQPLMFRRIGKNRYLVGDPDNPATIDCNLKAVAGIHAALAVPGRSNLVPAAKFTEQGSEYSGNSVGNGRRRFARDLENAGFRALASEVLKVRVKNGYLVAPLRRWVNLIVD